MRARSFASLYLGASILASLTTACGPHLKREVVRTGGAGVSLRGQPGGQPTTIELGRGNYDIALAFDVPRAQLIDYDLTCAGMPIGRGQLGETFEAYRERRLRQLRYQAEQDRRALASVTGAVVGAVAPDVTARGQAVGPAGTATVDAQVSGQAAGAAAGNAVAQSAIPQINDLPYGDVGAGRLRTNLVVQLGGPSTCTLTATADDLNVIVGYQVTQVRDLDAEARERRVAANASAHDVRIKLTGQLTVAGADPDARQKRLDAEAHARAEAEATRLRLRAEADAKRAGLRAEADAKRAKADAARAQVRAEEDARRALLRAETDAKRAQVRADEEARRAQLRADADAAQAADDARRAQLRAAADAERARIEGERMQAAQLKIEASFAIRQRRELHIRETRTLLVAYLEGECHADRNKAQREREARELRIRIELQAREEREARIALELETRNARLRAEREARDAKGAAEREAREQFQREQRAAVEAKAQYERNARLAVELEQRRVREAKAQQERDARLALELEQRRVREAAENHRIEVALNARASLRAYLIGLGARERPPMPALLVEATGSQPFDGAVWIAGTWQWSGGQWSWTAGGWQDSTRFGESGTAGGAMVSRGSMSSTTTTTTVSSSSTASGSASASASASTATASGSAGATIHVPSTVTVTVPSLPAGITIGGSAGVSTGAGPTVRDHRRR